ncbi:limbic system-associated membrane -like [Brachionus plicatilis]|uniref:Limbic system-associated membrane-like n=1 Tax=Brachionus plicatilis TaxID=10195 RepID=A0A3M7P6L3_BRAPC|nr:limbic system-associated membrane -like [Brachionus plicatilis]
MKKAYQLAYIFLLKILSISILSLGSQASHASHELSWNKSEARLKYHDLWHEENEVVVINCSLEVRKDQHVVWHRKYDKTAVHVLTIGSETFISDLRIRPIKQVFPSDTNALMDDDYKLTWNLEIRRLKKEDSALYYCVLNSENAYGQIYRLNVLSEFKILNDSEIFLNETDKKLENHDANRFNSVNNHVVLICKYDDVLGPNDHIRWYFNRHRIRSFSHFDIQNKSEQAETNRHSIIQIVDHSSKSTYSKLIIPNFNPKIDQGKYHCAYKGLIHSVRVHTENLNANSARFIYKQSIFSMLNTSTKNVSSMYTFLMMVFFYKFFH